MLKEVNRNAINQLIDYYQALNSLNGQFGEINVNDTKNTNYDNLIEELITVREFLINKSFDDINTKYKPTEGLFIHKNHYKILEDTVQFYKTNIDELYPIPAEKESKPIDDSSSINNGNDTELTSLLSQMKDNIIADTNDNLVQSCNDLKDQLSTVIEEKLAVFSAQNNIAQDPEAEKATHTDILSGLSDVKESLNKIIDDELNQHVMQSTQDTLAAIKTNHELMRSDIQKYDTLLTDHINKSGEYTLNAIEKEHARFGQKMSSDVNNIVAEITKANAAELATQSELIQTHMKQLEDKSFKWFVIMFCFSVFILFAGSVFSSTWAAEKAFGNAKVFRVATVCAPVKPVSPHKLKHNDND